MKNPKNPSDSNDARMNHLPKPAPLFLLVAGAKGAIGSTLAAALCALRKDPHSISPFLTTMDKFPLIGAAQEIGFAGWDPSPRTMAESIENHGVLPEKIWKPYGSDLGQIPVWAPPSAKDFTSYVKHLIQDIQRCNHMVPHSQMILVNLLPACGQVDLTACRDLITLYSMADPASFPDLAYVMAAIHCGLPVINFTSNQVELPPVVSEAVKGGVPLAGRDGKTGQTYLKVVLASALQARNLLVDGWYSLNILGNEDGKNLADPERATSKLANKTEVLEEILGYRVGKKYGTSSHIVRIDYYPPRADAKEAWDVVDFCGLFGMPMSLRINLLARDSILATPLIIDLARWMAALKMMGRAGLVPELAFFFKKPLGMNPPLNFQDQIRRLNELEQESRPAQ